MKSRTYTAVRVAAVASIALLGLAGCASGAEPASEGGAETTSATLALNFSPSGFDLPVYAALANGYYEDEGIDLEVLVTKSGQDAINAVTSGQAEIGTANLPYLAISASQGVETLSVGNRVGTHTFGLFIPESAGSDDLTGLEGKTVLAASAGIVDETKGLLEANGVDVSKVEFATIAASSLLTSYAGGQGDALVTSVPFGGPAVQTARPSYEIPFSDLGAEIPDYTYFVKPGTEKSDPELIEAFLRATYRGLQDALDDPETAVAGMAELVAGLNTDTALAQWEATVPFLCTVGAPDGSSVAELNEDSWIASGQIMADLAITPTLVDTSGIFTNEFTADVTDITCPVQGS